MRRSRFFNITVGFLIVCTLALVPCAAHAQLMIVGNDEKVTFDDAGRVVTGPEGKDTISIADIGTNPGVAKDPRQPATDELDRRPAGESGHHAR